MDLGRLGQHQQLVDRPRFLEQRDVDAFDGRAEAAQLLDRLGRLCGHSRIGATEQLVDDTDPESSDAVAELDRLAGEGREEQRTVLRGARDRTDGVERPGDGDDAYCRHEAGRGP